jgi:hypothetical protein
LKKFVFIDLGCPEIKFLNFLFSHCKFNFIGFYHELEMTPNKKIRVSRRIRALIMAQHLVGWDFPDNPDNIQIGNSWRKNKRKRQRNNYFTVISNLNYCI